MDRVVVNAGGGACEDSVPPTVEGVDRLRSFVSCGAELDEPTGDDTISDEGDGS